MKSQLIYAPFKVEDMAEGSPDPREDREPPTQLHTTEFPALSDESEKAISAAETGLVSAVKLGAEGRDDDDAQDSSLESGKMTPEADAKNAPTEDTDDATSVLIIEDTTELAEIIQVTLERMSMTVAHEARGNRAIETFKKMNPKVVLLDINLPDMTGWAIMEAIKARQEETSGRMPTVIVITAYDDPANRLVGKLQGIHSYLIKPFTAEEIEKAVSQAINSSAQ
jgi:CheY-like chemotaxis protein